MHGTSLRTLLLWDRWYIWVHKALYEQGENYSIVLYSILGTAHTMVLTKVLKDD